MPVRSRLMGLIALQVLALQPTASYAQTPSGGETQWLAVIVNSAPRDGLWAFTVTATGVWLGAEDARQLGLKVPEGQKDPLDLSQRKDLRIHLDSHDQTISLDLDARDLGGPQQRLVDQPITHPAYPEATALNDFTLGYSLYASDTNNQKQASALTSLSTSGWLPGTLQNTSNLRYTQGENEDTLRHTRLMTSWQYDDTAHNMTTIIGDSTTSGVSWSRQVRFGGIHIGRDFTLSPELNTSPGIAFSDSVALPSTVDLYIDGLKQSSQSVTPGAFILDSHPTFTGNGQAQVVITDINGQRREVSLSLYGAPSLLAKGISSGSLDMGWVRRDYGVRSDAYNRAMVADTGWRYGFTNNLTGTVHSELSQDMQNIGAGEEWLVSPRFGIISSHFTTSKNNQGQGQRWGAGYQWTGNRFSFSASTTRSTSGFSDIAVQNGALPILRSDTVWVSQSFASVGQFGAGWVNQQYSTSSNRYINGSWSKTFPHQITTSLSYSRALSGGDKNLTFTLSVPFNQHNTLSSQVGKHSQTWNYNHETDYQLGGWSWQAGQSWGDSRQQHADIGNKNRYGEWHLGMNNSADTRYYYGSGEGRISLLNSQFFALRNELEGLALVSTNGIGHVPVSLENRPAGETDDNGYLLLTNLPKHHSSKITIDPLGLPVDVLAPVTDISATPGNTLAVSANFNLRKSIMVNARLTTPDGKDLPMGSSVEVKDSQINTIIGRNGQLWLESPPLPAHITVHTPQGQCVVSLPARPADRSWLQYGSQICR